MEAANRNSRNEFEFQVDFKDGDPLEIIECSSESEQQATGSQGPLNYNDVRM